MLESKLLVLLSTGQNDKTLLWNVGAGGQFAFLDQHLDGSVFSRDGSMILDLGGNGDLQIVYFAGHLPSGRGGKAMAVHGALLETPL